MSDLIMPFMSITVGGKKLGNDVLSLVEGVRLEDSAQGSDILTIDLIDPAYEFINDKVFLEDQPVSFSGGFYNQRHLSFKGYISLIDIDFPQDGSPRLSIHCMDKTYLMNKKKNSKTWKNRRHSDIAREIFRKYGFKAVVHTTKKRFETVTQSKSTDIDFLLELADKQEEDYLVYVEGNTGYFIKKSMRSNPQATLYYRQKPYDITGFKPRIDKITKQIEI